MRGGTMAQQIGLRLWSERRGPATFAFHPTCHLDLHEERAYHALHGLRARLVGDARALITRADLSAIHEPLAALLLELPQREIGGLLPPWEELAAPAEGAHAQGIAPPMDGARLWESPCAPSSSPGGSRPDPKSTHLKSSHPNISYPGF